MSVKISGRILPSGGISMAGIITVAPPGQVEFSSAAGTFSWVVPENVTSISAVTIGGGGGGHDYINLTYQGNGGAGGALAYVNNIAVTPGETLTIIVGNGSTSEGGDGTSSYVRRGATNLVGAAGGQGGYRSPPITGGAPIVGTGGTGGAGGRGDGTNNSTTGGGGGAAGYGGNGGAGGGQNGATTIQATTGSGGGGGGGSRNISGRGAGGGGGVGLYGITTNGAAGNLVSGTAQAGGGGSGGAAGQSITLTDTGGTGGLFGGGGGAGTGGGDSGGSPGARGAVRILWGEGRSYPSNATNV